MHKDSSARVDRIHALASSLAFGLISVAIGNAAFGPAANADSRDPSIPWRESEVGWLDATDRYLGVRLETPSPRWQCFEVDRQREGSGWLPGAALTNEVRPIQDCLTRGETVRSTASPSDRGTRLELSSETGALHTIRVPAKPLPCPRSFEYTIGMSWADGTLPNTVRALTLDDRYLRLDLGDGVTLCWTRKAIQNVSPMHLADFVEVIDGWVRSGEALTAMIEIVTGQGGAGRMQRLELYRADDDIADALFELSAYGQDCPIP